MQRIPVSVYAEVTPNPGTMKFVANKLLIENGQTYEYTDPDGRVDSPLAMRLFNFPFIDAVFMSKNFVTLTKNDKVEDWQDVMAELREYITEYIAMGNPVLKENAQSVSKSETGIPQSQETAASAEMEAHGHSSAETDEEKKIISILEEYIQPAVANDGGAIHFKKYESEAKRLTVQLRGACSGCPSSMMTLKGGIENLFKQMMPEVQEVVAEDA